MIWRLHWFEWMFIVLLLTMISFMATAEEQEPCRADGTTVVCDRPAFDKLMKKVIDARAERDVLKVKLDAVVADRSDVEAALEACVAKPPVVIRPEPTPAWRAVGPVVLGVMGAVTLGVSVAGDFDARGRATGAVIGSALVGGAVIWALP